MSVKVFDIANGVQGLFVETKHHNTTLISYNFYLPLNGENMAEFALLPYLLTSCSKEYEEFTKLNLRLFELYGADLSCSVSKSGDYMHIKISINTINDELSYDKSKPVSEAAELITKLIFEPSVNGEVFKENDVSREKRKTVERIEGEINNKRSFARSRLLKYMFGDDPYGKFIYGTAEEVEKLDGKELYKTWKALLQTAIVRINVVGKSIPEGLFDDVKKRFSGLKREKISDKSRCVKLEEAEQAEDITERFDVSQGKIVMGFSSKLRGSIEDAAALTLCGDIFGGGPYSKLFENVREKQSLCYYCSAASRRVKGFLLVDSGIEEENAERLVAAVLEQLEDIKEGKFDDSLIEASKKAIIDSLDGCYDSVAALDGWHSKELGEMCSPKEAAEIINRVTREDIINAANGLKLHTVYRLLPKGGADR